MKAEGQLVEGKLRLPDEVSQRRLVEAAVVVLVEAFQASEAASAIRVSPKNMALLCPKD